MAHETSQPKKRKPNKTHSKESSGFLRLTCPYPGCKHAFSGDHHLRRHILVAHTQTPDETALHHRLVKSKTYPCPYANCLNSYKEVAYLRKHIRQANTNTAPVGYFEIIQRLFACLVTWQIKLKSKIIWPTRTLLGFYVFVLLQNALIICRLTIARYVRTKLKGDSTWNSTTKPNIKKKQDVLMDKEIIIEERRNMSHHTWWI